MGAALAVFYEIYPRSFADAKNNGTGNIAGITSKLDYLKSLGVDALWITPCYPSPQVDFGYDISDYCNIAPEYGTLADFDKLVAEAKKRKIKIIMDLVLNHTSDKHPWFELSRSSKTNPKRDWYVWRDGKPDGSSPNNWQALFGHSGWTFTQNGRRGNDHHSGYPEMPDHLAHPLAAASHDGCGHASGFLHVDRPSGDAGGHREAQRERDDHQSVHAARDGIAARGERT